MSAPSVELDKVGILDAIFMKKNVGQKLNLQKFSVKFCQYNWFKHFTNSLLFAENC